MNTATKIHAGQTRDPGYPVPNLEIGQVISGHTVIAAVRQLDRGGYLPGLHIVMGYDPGNEITPYVTWEVAWQARPHTHYKGEPRGQWVASGGHYFPASQGRDAQLDMLARAGRIVGEEG
jgi:hypothetical protein